MEHFQPVISKQGMLGSGAFNGLSRLLFKQSVSFTSVRKLLLGRGKTLNCNSLILAATVIIGTIEFLLCIVSLPKLNASKKCNIKEYKSTKGWCIRLYKIISSALRCGVVYFEIYCQKMTILMVMTLFACTDHIYNAFLLKSFKIVKLVFTID